MENVLSRELMFDTKTLAQLADGAATVKVCGNGYRMLSHHQEYISS
jgi:hypothetical protein